ncbi:hypothetical protein FGG08_006494 [Glutinoglossum americanum]|uniref:Molybdenum cofactor sulfurase n=1 Tax=Glutinoglossum americanum TaxID=1670608 RepID=A0A9P8HW71_9PEZI|nr:hypothetical protein FGG08_006494 [Glutinoglossum americanum]
MPSRSASMSHLRASMSQFQLPIQNFQTNSDYNHTVEEIRDSEYPMLKGRTYLDHGGTTLYARSLIEAFSDDMITNLYGNPHSIATPSELSTHRIDQIRERALRFFNADPDEYDLVFVPNATAGIKLVMECFRDLDTSDPTGGSPGKGLPSKTEGFWYGYHRDSHTSLVGVRETAGPNHRCFKNDGEVEKWLNDAVDGNGAEGVGASVEGRLGLFAYPGESNMTGRRLPLTWPGRLRRSKHAAHRNTYSLLDAAALATTAPIDLSDAETAPDFTVLSFYKIFGFPDLGALIIRRESGHILQWRKYFGGGTVEMVVCIKDAWHSKKTTSMHDQLEDGTLPFHSIFALGIAMDVHERLFDSMESISRHTSYLSKRMYEGLLALQHQNGLPVCRIYKEDAVTYGDSKKQGATIAFNVQNSKGELVPYSEVERLADTRNIYLRAGGLCNPGGIAVYLGFAPWQMKRSFSAGHRCGNDAEGSSEIVSGKPIGVVRASLGAMSSESDVTNFLDFVRDLFLEKQHLGTPLLHVTPVLRKPKTPQYQIECLRVYPIKGCGGYNIPSGRPWEVGAKGLYLDREWCIVHLDTGTALSRKRYPKMAKIRPIIDLDKGVLTISALHSEHQPELKISLSWSFLEDGDGYRNNRRHSSSNFRASASKVCGDPIPAHPYTSPHIVEFFSAAVGARCTLARFSASNTNSTKDLEARHTKAYLRRSYSSNNVSGLASAKAGRSLASNRLPPAPSNDAQVVTRPVLLPSESPISVITRNSLEWHNQQVKATKGKAAQPELFRANIVLAEMQSGETRGRKLTPAAAQANIEDNWAFVRIGSLSFELLGPCGRCHLTCADQIAAEKDNELFPVLARTRRFDGEVYFDQDPARVILRRDNPNAKKPTISVGDTVRTWLSSEVYEKPSSGALFGDDDNEFLGRIGNLGNASIENGIHLNQRSSIAGGDNYRTSIGGDNHPNHRASVAGDNHLSHRASDVGSIILHHRASSMEVSNNLNHRASQVSIRRKNIQSPTQPSPAPNTNNNPLTHRTSTNSIHRNTNHNSIIGPPTTTTTITANGKSVDAPDTTTPNTYRPPSATGAAPAAAPVDVDLIEYAPLKATTFGRSSPKPPPARSLSGRPGPRNAFNGINGAPSSSSPTLGRAQSPVLMGVAEAERRINELTNTSRSSSEGSSTSGKWRHKIAESVVSMLDRPTTAGNF